METQIINDRARCVSEPVNELSVSFHDVMWTERPDILPFIPNHSWTQTREGHDTNLNMGKNESEPEHPLLPPTPYLTLNSLPLLIVVKQVTWRLLFFLTNANLWLSVYPLLCCISPVVFPLTSQSQNLCPSWNTEALLQHRTMSANTVVISASFPLPSEVHLTSINLNLYTTSYLQPHAQAKIKKL